MSRPITEPLWQQLTEELTREMRQWRLLHPKATLRQIETELDARLARMRARMLEDLALTSSTAVWTQRAEKEQPLCPDCQQPLAERGAKTRTLQTHGGQLLRLTRSYGVCPACGSGLFPPR
jgi:hypothetical protein